MRPIVWADVTNTVEGTGTTGVQRAAKNLLAPLAAGDERLELRLVRWCEPCGTFLQLNAAEQERFAAAAPPPTRRVDRLPQRVRPAARRAADHPAIRRLNAAAQAKRQGEHPYAEHRDRSTQIDSGTFLDLDAAWHNPLIRTDLLPDLIDRGVRTATLFHDLFPIEHPDWSDRGTRALFPPWADAHLRSDQLIVGNSDWTLRRALDRRRSLGVTDPEVAGVVHLSGEWQAVEVASPGAASPAAASPSPLPPELEGLPLDGYVICVATLEPRKNHALLLDAFDRWSTRSPGLGLVLVGRIGWNTGTLVKRIETHPLLNRQLFWFAHSDDPAMRNMLRLATVAAMPSHTEGFGLPVLEALALGTPVVTTNGGALAEVGDDAPLRLPGDDPATWAEALVRHLDDPHYLARRREEARAAALTLPTWEDARDELADLLTR
ncbi:glycosyltransferase family 4 protein [Candidatus Microthrix sp.]|jgi:glycosyltransferase involved in cell wall biosynthesis|uniref:glycosyltransferase family 4 protein n=1 Tax=Candidatus Neomicrothrix sp. TaxID=2719034 RepID=UPI001B55E6D2|nr:glycosyltransferase family 1 protein [Candidatus Microthrix sp.]MBP8957702.1 glycosyltransferase family 4 protein [Candidatus Microthrix sp.]